jgi:exopolyphosphatase/pppGpp-phosphohydrolase
MADPQRIGIVDMGSNAIRFLVAEATAGAIAVLESHRLAVRLGHDVFHTGQIPEPTIGEVVAFARRATATACSACARSRRRRCATRATATC